ncbi:MAG: ribbon-helix-helix protein, CopG family [Alphaproteobacteria bacterium]|nr:MAG: ribbon-helix-helix protein, CopG family [Alphaproteobacteria bacterium]
MSESEVVTVRLTTELKARLDALAKSTKRTRSFLAAEAIANYVEINAWQIEEIEKGLQEVEAGDFLTEEEQAEAYARWRS